MWKQALGFALFGATVAIVTAALTQGSAQASATITLFSGGTTISGFAGESQWTWPIEAAVIGALLGALTGFVLRLAGVRISGSQDNRLVRTVVAGIAGVTLGLTPLLVLIGRHSPGRLIWDGPRSWSTPSAVFWPMAFRSPPCSEFFALPGIDLLFARRERSRRCFR